MSWSVNFIGSIDNIKAAVEAESQRLTGQSKQEFDEAKPHIIGLLDQNVTQTPMYNLSANGHGTWNGKEYVNKYLGLKLETVHAKIV